jgi:hypothetical protein
MEATKCIVNGDSNECYQSFTVKRMTTPPLNLQQKCMKHVLSIRSMYILASVNNLPLL